MAASVSAVSKKTLTLTQVLRLPLRNISCWRGLLLSAPYYNHHMSGRAWRQARELFDYRITLGSDLRHALLLFQAGPVHDRILPPFALFYSDNLAIGQL